MSKLKHYDEFGMARFITFSCYRRYKLFNREYVYEVFLKHLESFRRENDISILGYVIMPNHVNLVLYPHWKIEMGRSIGHLKSKFAYEILSEWKRIKKNRLERLWVYRGGKESFAFWQLRCYDHNCRSPETVREKIHYCHNNPVKSGLVASPEEWRWSSYKWYMGNRPEIVRVDEIDVLC
ncbi:MAG: transposase [candidate division Zixibacteria bacterium]